MKKAALKDPVLDLDFDPPADPGEPKYSKSSSANIMDHSILSILT